MREIVLDTETTGLDPAQGHRLVEIGAVEMINQIATGAVYHVLINPQRDVPDEAYRVHGHSTEFLRDKPVFAEVVEEFLAFIAEDRLVIHNAEFDIRFLNAELTRLGQPALATDLAVDTLLLARRRFPGSPASLDALCRRFNIDDSARSLHGALLDAELLAEVYLELIGGRQAGFDLEQAEVRAAAAIIAAQGPARPPRPHAASLEELVAHAALLDKLKQPLWRM